MNKTTEQILSQLKESNSWFETFTHEPVLTSEQAAKVRPGYSLEQGAKALVLKTTNKSKESKCIMVVLAAHTSLDSKALKNELDLREMRFVTQEELSELTGGILPGAVPPFGNLFNLDVFVTQSLLKNEKIVFNAGERTFSIAMYLKDYLTLVQPTILSIS